MAAFELFTYLIAGLSEKELEVFPDLVHSARADLFAARSEEARVRIVNEFILSVVEARTPSAG